MGSDSDRRKNDVAAIPIPNIDKRVVTSVCILRDRQQGFIGRQIYGT